MSGSFHIYKEACTVSTIIWPQKSMSSIGHPNHSIQITDMLENPKYTQFDLKIALFYTTRS
jgi:hypothetical protein